MAEEKKNPLGPTGERLRDNIRRIREAKRLTYVELSERMDQVGRPIPVLGLRRIERGERRVDVDDLVALSVVLNVSMAALLLPPEWSNDDLELTRNHKVSTPIAWQWAEGQMTAADEQDREREQAEYLALSTPQGRRQKSSHQSVRLAMQVVELLDEALSPEEGAGPETAAVRIRMARRRFNQLGIDLEELEEVLDPRPIVHPGVGFEQLQERVAREATREEDADEERGSS